MIRLFPKRVLVAALGIAVLTLAVASPAGAQTGDVSVVGSSTVEPISSLVAELYAEENPDVSVRVDGPGTGDGFQLFCDGETDMADASRPIAEPEIADCEENGIEYTELAVAIDGLTVVVNRESDIRCLTFNDLYALFGPESGGGETDLADASELASELGGSELPDEGSVEKFTPGPESGTYDSFLEITYEDLMETRLEEGSIPEENVGTNDEGEPEVTEPLLAAGTFPNDNDIVQRIQDADNSIGFFGFAYFVENKEGLRAVRIQDPETGECVKPKAKTVRDGSYPISRLLYVYPNNDRVAASEAVEGFGDFYFTEENLTDVVEEVGYVALPEDQIQATIEAWDGIA